jgi:DNA-binding transcriptional regulator YhcF (GntR family)
MIAQEAYMKSQMNTVCPQESKRLTWVQTERASHEAWGKLTIRSPRAAALAHYLVAHMEQSGAVIASYGTLAKIAGMSVATVRRAIDDLKADRWIEVVQVGGKGGANAFIINSRVAWAQTRDKLHLAAFTARVIADKEDQPCIDDVPLRKIPILRHGEMQLPTGPGEDPPSQPSFDGMEPNLPVLHEDEIIRKTLEDNGQKRLVE